MIWYVIDQEDSDENGTLVAVDVETGQVQQRIATPDFRFDELLYMDDQWILGWSNRRIIFAIDRSKPDQVAWHTNRADYFSVEKVVRTNDSFVFTQLDLVYALDVESGQEKWSFDTDTERPAAQSVTQPLLSSPWNEDAQRSLLYAVDATSGEMAWRYDGYDTSYLVSGDNVYFADRNSAGALDLMTGQVLWQVDIDSQYYYYEVLP